MKVLKSMDRAMVLKLREFELNAAWAKRDAFAMWKAVSALATHKKRGTHALQGISTTMSAYNGTMGYAQPASW